MADTVAASPDQDVVAIPSSYSQESLWFLDRLHKGSAAYNVPLLFEIDGALDTAALRAALNDVATRHESLRTAFRELDGQLVQVIADAAAVEFQVDDIRGHEQEQVAARNWAQEQASRPFDLSVGPLWRAAVLRLGPERWWLALTMHHIVVDGWSVAVVLEELGNAYAARRRASAVAREPVPSQFADYAIWLRESAAGGAFDESLSRVRESIGDYPHEIEISVGPPPAECPRFSGGKVFFDVDPRVLEAAAPLLKAEQATRFMLLLAAWGTLVARLAHQDRLLIGCPVAARPMEELERAVGFFANVVPMPFDLRGAPTCRELLRRVRTGTLSSFEHQLVPFELVVTAVNPRRVEGRNPLFQVMFAVQSGAGASLSLQGLRVQQSRVDNGTAKFDLLLELEDRPDGVRGHLEFDSARFERSAAEALVSRFLQVLAAIVGHPDRPAADVDILLTSERQTLTSLASGADSSVLAASIVDLLEAACHATPSTPAIEYAGQQVTYKELWDRVGTLAASLRGHGVSRGSVVAVAVGRSIEQIVAVLAVMRAGGAYLPLDLALPRARLRFMIQQASVRLLLTREADATTLREECPDRTVLTVEQLAASAPVRSMVLEHPAPTDSAYILFTSGSTGRPKGVEMHHGALANLVSWQVARSAARGVRRTLQFSPIGFDVSFQEIAATLGGGGTLVLVDEATRQDPRLLRAFVARHRIERLFLPFVALQLLADVAQDAEELHLKEVITAGEALQVTSSIRRFFGSMGGCVLENQYGPTEAHVVTALTLEGDPEHWPDAPSIGRPIPNVKVFVVDAQLQPVPIGAVGELVIGGVAPAKGYVGDPAQTGERFVEAGAIVGGRVYRTGDLGRMAPDGQIHFLGRRDQQVKIRGFRVEVAEVEAAVADCGEVSACAVAVQKTERGARLVAYVVPRDGGVVDPAKFRAVLKERLPDHMVPSVFVALERLPMTATGKVDRARLPAAPEGAAAAEQRSEAAPGSLAARVARIWADALGAESVSLDADFFDLGGQSIIAAKLVGALEREVGVPIPVATLFRAPTVRLLCEKLQSKAGLPEARRITRLNGGDDAQLPMFLIHAVAGEVLAYARLARRLTRPVYGVQASIHIGSSECIDDIRAIADEYRREIQAVQPSGPYIVGGWSAGGTIALEVAQQLMTRGERVLLLVEIDSAPYNSGVPQRRLSPDYWWKIAANLPRWIDDEHRTGGLAAVPARILRRLRSYVSQLSGGLSGASRHADEVGGFVDMKAISPFMHEFMLRAYAALKTYVPRRFEGRVLLFKARVHPLTKLHETDRIWRSLCDDVAVVPIPGSHLGVTGETQAAIMAEAIEASIRSTPAVESPSEHATSFSGALSEA